MLIGWNNHERGFWFTRIALRFLVFSSPVKMPFRRDKTRGGVQADSVGYFFDWENLVGDLPAKRAAWLVNWARTPSRRRRRSIFYLSLAPSTPGRQSSGTLRPGPCLLPPSSSRSGWLTR